MTSLRPDERAAMSQIDRAQSSDRMLKRGAKTALGLATGGAGAALSSRILPFMSQYIPKDLALKGISKVSPTIGNFLQSGLNNGLTLKDGFDFVKDNLMSSEEKKEPAKENRNVIEQYSPELHQFIANEVSGGRPVIEAGALAQANPKFKAAIKQIEKDHKTNWSAILQSIYGGGQYGGPVNPPQAQQMGQPMQGQGQQQQAQQGPGMQNLMAALQAATQARQKRQGPM